MQALAELFQYEYAWRALAAAVLTGVLCGILGCFILLRNMSLIGDALSHAILPGVVGGFLIAGHSVVAFFTGSVIAGLLSAVLITWLQRNVKTREDAAIGIVFSAMFALGVMGISRITRQEGVHLDMKDFLFGNILGVSPLDLVLMFGITAFVILCVTAFYRYFFITTFQPVMATTLGIPSQVIHYFLMLLLSFAIVASLQAVGVILAVAMLIIPASTAYLVSKRLKVMIVLSVLVGVFSSVTGFLLSVLLETTPGPAMTLTAALVFVLVMLLAPGKGLINRMWGRRQLDRTHQAEDVLKLAVKLQEKSLFDLPTLEKELGLNASGLRHRLRRLMKMGYLNLDKGEYRLTDEGRKRGYQLIRAHRLWESYLVEKEGLLPDQSHDHAEELEHRMPEGFLKNIEFELGYPKFDPHGSPIPQAVGAGMLLLSQLKPEERALITTDQPGEHSSSEMWKRGITPNTPFVFLHAEDQQIAIQLGSKKMQLPIELAAQVWVVRL